jgi:hypothetical protein
MLIIPPTNNAVVFRVKDTQGDTGNYAQPVFDNALQTASLA